jgi:hypothetical protein
MKSPGQTLDCLAPRKSGEAIASPWASCNHQHH